MPDLQWSMIDIGNIGMSGKTEKTDDPMIVRAMDKGHFVRVNDSFKARTGFDAAELAEKPFLDWIVPGDRASVQAALDDGEKSFFARHVTQDGNPLRLRIQTSAHGEGLYVLGQCATVPARPEPNQPRPAEATMSGTLDAIARIIEEQNPGLKCSILLVDQDRFVFGAGPSLPDDYNAAVNGYAVGPTVGSCGTAIFWNTPVIVEDIQADPLWAALAALAKKAGVAACWSHPFVSSNGKVLGALAFYAPESCAPTAEQLSRLRAAARITGLAVERGRAEEELRRTALALDEMKTALAISRDLLQKVIDTAPVRVFWKDRDSRYLGCNPAFALDAGMSAPTDLIGRDDFSLSWAEQAELYRADDRMVMESGLPRLGYEEPQTTPGGGVIWLRTSKVPLRSASGEIVGVLGLYEDITAQKREERRMALALDAARVLIWEVDFSTGRFDYDGRGMSRLGLDETNSPDTLNDWLARVHPDDRGRFLETVEQTLRAEHTHGFDCEYRFMDSSGLYHWLHSVGRVVHRDAKERPMLGAGYTTNITERKLIEEELARHRERLEAQVEERTAELTKAKVAAEAANRAKSTFLATMSHELRTPMHGVMGMIDLARRRMADPKGLDQLDKAKHSAERLLGVINDILDLSKIEAERMVLDDQPLKLGSVLEDLRATLGNKAGEKGLHFAIDIPSPLAQTNFEGDPLRLGQILLNLVGNAIKFTDGGAITVRVRNLGETAGVAQLRFEVADTGVGIDADARDRLFQSFEQADNSMTRKYGGTGLGLAICKRLVQLMGGEIGVDSAPGQGSTFWFVISLKKREAVAASPVSMPAPATAEARLQAAHFGTHVLVAEDEPVNQEVARDLLEHVGLIVDLAEDGQQALDLARENIYSLILMDMQMPTLNGIDATQKIRADSRNMCTPIIAMTANAFEDDRRACMAAGMNEHISKPVDPDRLYETLYTWLEKDRAQAVSRD